MKNITGCEDCNVLQCSAFSKISLSDQKYISSNKYCTTYKKGMTIFCTGTKPVGVYCLKQGRVKIIIFGIQKEHTIRFIKPGELFGLDSMLTENNFHCCATVVEEATVCRIYKQDFIHILMKYPQLSFDIMSSLSRMIEDANNKIISLAQKSVRERTAESLLYLYQYFRGEKQEALLKDSTNCGIKLSREDIANVVGTSTETVIRMISEFKSDGYISVKGKNIFIRDSYGLKKIAGT